MTPIQVAWVKLIAITASTGCAATATAFAGGAKVWVAALIGVGVAGTNIYHALSPSPNDTINPLKQP